jgi:hypothetical protein
MQESLDLRGMPEVDIIPDEEPLPQYSAFERRLGPGVTHQMWFNTLLKRFTDYGQHMQASGLPISMQEFATQEGGFNNPTRLRKIGAATANKAGIRWKKKHRINLEYVPLSPGQAYELKEEIRESDRRPKRTDQLDLGIAAKIGEALLAGDLVPYDPKTRQVKTIKELIDDTGAD